MECYICKVEDFDELEDDCKFFSIGKSKIIVCSRCLSASSPEEDFKDVIRAIEAYQAIDKNLKKKIHK